MMIMMMINRNNPKKTNNLTEPDDLRTRHIHKLLINIIGIMIIVKTHINTLNSDKKIFRNGRDLVLIMLSKWDLCEKFSLIGHAFKSLLPVLKFYRR